MSILSELQSRKLGLIELLSMGFEVYLKNFKNVLLVYCTTYLPFLIILLALASQTSTNPSGLFLTFYWFWIIVVNLASLIYSIAISVITDNYVHGINTSYQSVVKKIFSSIIPLFSLGIRFGINYLLRCLLLLIPGIIYIINNGYCGLAFILRDQRGKAAFAYSRSIVKGNWWKVFLFYFLLFSSLFGLQIIFSKSLNTVPFMNNFWVSLLSQTLPQFIGIGIGISNILLFLNLDYHESSGDHSGDHPILVGKK